MKEVALKEALLLALELALVPELCLEHKLYHLRTHSHIFQQVSHQYQSAGVQELELELALDRSPHQELLAHLEE